MAGAPALPPAHSTRPRQLSQSRRSAGASLNRPREQRVPAGPPCPAALGAGSEIHTPNPPALPPHPRIQPGAQTRQPASTWSSVLGYRGTTPNTGDCLSCQRRTPTWASTPLPGQGEAWLGEGQVGRGHRAHELETLLLPARAPEMSWLRNARLCSQHLWLWGPQPSCCSWLLKPVGPRRRRRAGVGSWDHSREGGKLLPCSWPGRGLGREAVGPLLDRGTRSEGPGVWPLQRRVGSWLSGHQGVLSGPGEAGAALGGGQYLWLSLVLGIMGG